MLFQDLARVQISGSYLDYLRTLTGGAVRFNLSPVPVVPSPRISPLFSEKSKHSNYHG